MAYSSDGEAATATSDRKIATRTVSDLEKAVMTPPASAETLGRGKALPVAANEVSFNLSISADEEAAKRSVQLPYMHHRTTGDSTVNTLLFIDDDDPDWDDDDLDDDLDI
jgi:elongator complex protein 5